MVASPLIFAVVALSLNANPAAVANAPCQLANVESTRELHEVLSLRAIKIVELAAAAHAGDAALAALVAPSASFNLGAGDVGRPLEAGVEGARALARAMDAETYRYLGWNYMDGPAQPCATQKVMVEFLDTRNKRVSQVEFTFEAGRLVDATGWVRSYETGALESARAQQ
jgi:hypothetical protein